MSTSASQSASQPASPAAAPVKRRPGRPKRQPVSQPITPPPTPPVVEQQAPPAKRRPGRPRRQPASQPASQPMSPASPIIAPPSPPASPPVVEMQAAPAKRQVGRPRVKPAVDLEAASNAKVHSYTQYRQRADGSVVPVTTSYVYIPRKPRSERAMINEVRDTIHAQITDLFKECHTESEAVDLYAALSRASRAARRPADNSEANPRAPGCQ
jgi:hypothetical protein